MKSILMSIKPKWFAKILNGEKTVEIRKKFPIDYVGWVYIYCTKDRPYITGIYNYEHKIVYGDIENKNHNINGKVVARFWCDKVASHRPFFHWCIEKETCLTRDDVLDYLDSKDKSVGNPKRQDKVYAIHITKLETFDKPKPLSQFLIPSHKVQGIDKDGSEKTFTILKPLDRAPQSWCYIEI